MVCRWITKGMPSKKWIAKGGMQALSDEKLSGEII